MNARNPLKAARLLAGLSIRDLADAAQVHAKTVAYWERQHFADQSGHGVQRVREALDKRGVTITPDAVKLSPDFTIEGVRVEVGR